MQNVQIDFLSMDIHLLPNSWLKLFFPRGSLTLISIHGESLMNTDYQSDQK